MPVGQSKDSFLCKSHNWVFATLLGRFGLFLLFFWAFQICSLLWSWIFNDVHALQKRKNPDYYFWGFVTKYITCDQPGFNSAHMSSSIETKIEPDHRLLLSGLASIFICFPCFIILLSHDHCMRWQHFHVFNVLPFRRPFLYKNNCTGKWFVALRPLHS